MLSKWPVPEAEILRCLLLKSGLLQVLEGSAGRFLKRFDHGAYLHLRLDLYMLFDMAHCQIY